jgi:cytochrome c peroxidase
MRGAGIVFWGVLVGVSLVAAAAAPIPAQPAQPSQPAQPTPPAPPAQAAPPAAAAPAAPAAPAVPSSPELIKRGFQLFNDKSLSATGQFACATCHPNGGGTNNKTYVGTEVVKDGTPEGRSTPTLFGAKDTAPYSWAGGKTLHDNIKGIIVNRMKGKEPSEDTLTALMAYVSSLQFPANKNLNADGSPKASAPEAAKRGYAVFQKGSCNVCHVPPTFAKPDNEDIGSGGSFNVPSLRGLSGTAPYFHDGRYPDLKTAVPATLNFLKQLGTTEDLSDKEVQDLIAYLQIL